MYNASNKVTSGTDEKTNENPQKTCEESLNAKNIWGVFVAKLKSLNLITLYTACGEIRDVKFNKNNLVVNIKEGYLYNILAKPENEKKVEEILASIDSRIKVKFEKYSNKDNNAKQNLDRLKNLFGKDLNFK